METISIKTLKDLLKYAPKEVLVQIILNVEPKDLQSFCKTNKRVMNLCQTKELRNRYFLKYPYPIMGPLKKIEDISSLKHAPKFLTEEDRDDEEVIYTDGFDNWVSTEFEYVSYVSRIHNVEDKKLRALVKLFYVMEDEWDMRLELYDEDGMILDFGTPSIAKVFDKVFSQLTGDNLARKRKEYLKLFEKVFSKIGERNLIAKDGDEYYSNAKNKEGMKFLRRLQKAGIELDYE